MAQHLTFAERERISQMHEDGASGYEIATELLRARSTISRELRRNLWQGSYSPVVAQHLSRQRRSGRVRKRKLDDRRLNDFVRRGLTQNWSPDQIAGRSAQAFAGDGRRQVSAPTVYAWIRSQSPPLRAFWRGHLRRGGRRRSDRDRRGQLPAQTFIEGRPRVVDRRARFGDWEGDTIVGSGRSGVLITLVERKSGFLCAAQSNQSRARPVRYAIQRLLRPLPPALRHTITFDNGKEFAEHRQLAARLNIQVYFAEPYCAWQRGTNENTNGLLRQFFPRGTPLGKVRNIDVRKAVRSLNDRPRKRLRYRTPREVLHAHLPSLKRCI
jgi:transposase, IS30 family